MEEITETTPSPSFFSSFRKAWQQDDLARSSEPTWKLTNDAVEWSSEHYWGYYSGVQANRRWAQAKIQPIPAILWPLLFSLTYYRHSRLSVCGLIVGMGTIVVTQPGSVVDGYVKFVPHKLSTFPSDKAPLGLAVFTVFIAVCNFSPSKTSLSLRWLTWPVALLTGLAAGNWLQTDSCMTSQDVAEPSTGKRWGGSIAWLGVLQPPSNESNTHVT